MDVKRAVGLTLLGSACAAAIAATPLVAPFSVSTDGQLPASWRVVTLPKIPRHTRYTLVMRDGQPVVQAEANGSYANLVHTLKASVAATPILKWRWRVDRFPAASNLSVKSGDDIAAKVCVLYDLPLDRLSADDRMKVELGRRLFDSTLPGATVCYIWDRTGRPGTWLPNVYTDRVRMLVLRSDAAGQRKRWFGERRDLRADFARAFGAEAAGGLPPVTAIAIATDADNTGGTALAYFGDIALVPE
jgi:Protein of unknown function (DUF3047)